MIYCAFTDTVKEIVGGFDAKQMIAIGVIALIALVLGFFIGGFALYAAGVRKGKRRGAKDAVEMAMQRAEEDASGQIKKALNEEKARSAAIQKEKDDALVKTQEQLKQAEQSKEEAERAALAAEKSKEEAERAAREAEDKMRALRESEAAGETIIRERKKRIDLLSKAEIIAYAEGLNEYLPTALYERGGENLPDSCRVGICTFMLVYERKNMVKLVLRLHKKTAAALEKQFKLFTKAVYPKGGDWYKWILSSEVTDLDVVTAAVRMAYKYVYLSYYGDKSGEINVNYVNKEENRINEAILKYQNLPDRDFVVASDAAEGANAAYRLYGKREMTDYCLSLSDAYPVSVSESESDLAPNTFKVDGKAFMMAYEKDGVSKMIFRLSDEAFTLLKKKHPTAEISPFPKASGYHWYAACVDETFSSNADIEEIIRNACAHVHALYGKK